MTILIKRNPDRNYDRLFARVEEATILGRAASVSERETPGGYAVEFKFLDADTIAYLMSRPRDFEILD